MISKLRRSRFPFFVFQFFSFSLENDMLTSTYFGFFNERPALNDSPPRMRARKLNEHPGAHLNSYGK